MEKRLSTFIRLIQVRRYVCIKYFVLILLSIFLVIESIWESFAYYATIDYNFVCIVHSTADHLKLKTSKLTKEIYSKPIIVEQIISMHHFIDSSKLNYYLSPTFHSLFLNIHLHAFMLRVFVIFSGFIQTSTITIHVLIMGLRLVWIR